MYKADNLKNVREEIRDIIMDTSASRHMIFSFHNETLQKNGMEKVLRVITPEFRKLSHDDISLVLYQMWLETADKLLDTEKTDEELEYSLKFLALKTICEEWINEQSFVAEKTRATDILTEKLCNKFKERVAFMYGYQKNYQADENEEIAGIDLELQEKKPLIFESMCENIEPEEPDLE